MMMDNFSKNKSGMKDIGFSYVHHSELNMMSRYLMMKRNLQ